MDKVLETILDVSNEMKTELSDDVIEKYYQLHKDNQFREDRTLVMGEIRQLISESIRQSKKGGND